MPHRGLSELPAGPEPIELRADGALSILIPLNDGGDQWSDPNIAGGNGALREENSASDAPAANKDLETLRSRVQDYATSISDALDELEIANVDTKTALAQKVKKAEVQRYREICGRIATEIVRASGWLNAWMAYLYKHPAYEATKGLREEGLTSVLATFSPERVDQGIAKMRQVIAAVKAIDLAEAMEVPYEEMNPEMTKEQAAAIAAYRPPAHLEAHKKA